MILCLGTTPAVQRAMIFDRLVMSGVNRAAQVIEAAAGKSVNVARVLAALGDDVLATGFVGGDRGEFLRCSLEADGIGHDFVTIAPRTRQCVTVIDRATATHTELIEESAAIEAEGWAALLGKLPGLLRRSKLLVLSGSVPPGAPLGFYADCVRIAEDAGVPAVVDAAGEPLLQALQARPALVKPNRAELALSLKITIDSDASLLEAMQRVIEGGAQAVVVTLGGEGAAAFDGQSFWRIRVPPVAVVNSIGSGDAFTAGLASAMVRGRNLAEACRLGAACGAANAMTLLAGEVHAADVERLLPQVTVEAV